MKTLISFLLFTSVIFAQTPNAVLQDQMNFEPGELIVKLKDDVDAAVTYSRSGEASSDFKIGELLETHKHSTEDILNECLDHERSAIDAYYKLLKNIEGESIMLEEFARTMIATEEMHEAELKKMLKDNF